MLDKLRKQVAVEFEQLDNLEYLKFRHFFRQAYSFQFEWEKLSSLALGCENTLRRLEEQMKTFFGRIQ